MTEARPQEVFLPGSAPVGTTTGQQQLLPETQGEAKTSTGAEMGWREKLSLPKPHATLPSVPSISPSTMPGITRFWVKRLEGHREVLEPSKEMDPPGGCSDFNAEKVVGG